MGVLLKVRDITGTPPVAMSTVADTFSTGSEIGVGRVPDKALPGTAYRGANENSAAGFPQISGGRVTSAGVTSGMRWMFIDVGTSSYDVVVRMAVAKTSSATPTSAVAASYNSTTGDYVMLQQRVDAGTLEYVLTEGKLGGSAVAAARTYVTPQSGDVVWIQRRGASFTVLINGVEVAQATVTRPLENNAGLRFASVDTETAFDDFYVYARS